MLLFMMCGLHAAEVYKVIDEHGRVHYSQIPPHNDAEKVNLKSSNNQATNNGRNDNISSQEKQKKYSDYLQSERLERKEKREQRKQEKTKLASQCNETRAELSDMNQGGILYYDLDENGERVYIDESKIEAKKRNLQKYLDKNC